MAKAIKQIDPALIKINKAIYFREDMGSISRLAEDIRLNGNREPILIKQSPNGKNYYSIDGWKRVLATRMAIKNGAKIKTIPANIAPENIERKDEILMVLNAVNSKGGTPLKPTEEGRAIETLMTKHDVSAREIGKNTALTTPTVINRKNLLLGSPRLQAAVDNENYPVTIAKLIINKFGNDFSKQDKLVNETTFADQDSAKARIARKELVAKLSGLTALYHKPVKDLLKLMRQANISASSIDDAIDKIKEVNDKDLVQMATLAGIVKGLKLALGSKMDDPFKKAA
ncbi:MAG: hypothetical protein QM500_08820 [Methylococcales bacterium]